MNPFLTALNAVWPHFWVRGHTLSLSQGHPFTRIKIDLREVAAHKVPGVRVLRLRRLRGQWEDYSLEGFRPGEVNVLIALLSKWEKQNHRSRGEGSSGKGGGPNEHGQASNAKLLVWIVTGSILLATVPSLASEDPGASEMARTGFRQKLLGQVGQRITITGTANPFAKFGCWVQFDGGGVYLRNVSEAAQRLLQKGATVEAVGILRFEPAAKSLEPSVSGVPERFYLDVRSGSIKLQGRAY